LSNFRDLLERALKDPHVVRWGLGFLGAYQAGLRFALKAIGFTAYVDDDGVV